MEVKRKIPWMLLPTFSGSYFESFHEKLSWQNTWNEYRNFGALKGLHCSGDSSSK